MSYLIHVCCVKRIVGEMKCVYRREGTNYGVTGAGMCNTLLLVFLFGKNGWNKLRKVYKSKNNAVIAREQPQIIRRVQ